MSPPSNLLPLPRAARPAFPSPPPKKKEKKNPATVSDRAGLLRLDMTPFNFTMTSTIQTDSICDPGFDRKPSHSSGLIKRRACGGKRKRDNKNEKNREKGDATKRESNRLRKTTAARGNSGKRVKERPPLHHLGTVRPRLRVFGVNLDRQHVPQDFHLQPRRHRARIKVACKTLRACDARGQQNAEVTYYISFTGTVFVPCDFPRCKKRKKKV